jgi:DNA-binding FrmR family transcriptional regulator
MKLFIGAVGWLLVGSGAFAAASCDKSKETCEKMVAKYESCIPKLIDEQLQALPEATRQAAGEVAKQKIEETVRATLEDTKKQCATGTFSDQDKKEFAAIAECVDKECKDFVACFKEKGPK